MPSKRCLRVARSVLDSLGRDDCAFCRRKINASKDQLLYGSHETTTKLSVHYFCLLFSSGLSQEGEDSQGIKGFLEKDILSEIGRGAGLLCSFCRKPGATIGCVIEKCRKVVHFPCGLKNDMTFNFASSSFDSFCSEHTPFPTDSLVNVDAVCSICTTNFKATPAEASQPLLCPTCHNPFHIHCLRQTASKFGVHHFRCPFCRDDSQFVVHCQQSGIYVPDQDAAWELQDAAFDYETRHSCDAFNCYCPGGREVDDKKWDLARCNTCGLNAAHIRCRNLGEDGVYICADCIPLPPKRTDGKSKCNKSLWFYSKSRFHFREPAEEMLALSHAVDDDEVVDVDSDKETRLNSSQSLTHGDSSGRGDDSSFSDLILLDSDDDVPAENNVSFLPSPSKWLDFHVRFSPEECQTVRSHLPQLPTKRRNSLPEATVGEPSCSTGTRSPLVPLQQQ